MQQRKLKTALFGYKKKDVTAFVDELITEYEQTIQSQKEEIAQIKKQNQALIAENGDSFKKLRDLEAEREYVSKAVISAEKRAKCVIEEAEKEMATLKTNKMAEIALANEELEKLKTQIESLKKSAVATLKKYEAQMNDLIK